METKAEFREQLDHYLEKYDFDNQDNLIAAAIDPGYKPLTFLEKTEKDEIYKVRVVFFHNFWNSY